MQSRGDEKEFVVAAIVVFEVIALDADIYLHSLTYAHEAPLIIVVAFVLVVFVILMDENMIYSHFNQLKIILSWVEFKRYFCVFV